MNLSLFAVTQDPGDSKCDEYLAMSQEQYKQLYEGVAGPQISDTTAKRERERDLFQIPNCLYHSFAQ